MSTKTPLIFDFFGIADFIQHAYPNEILAAAELLFILFDIRNTDFSKTNFKIGIAHKKKIPFQIKNLSNNSEKVM